MTSRLDWTQQNKEVAQAFHIALQLSNELNEELSDHLDIQEEIEILKDKQKSWEEHRFEIVVIGEFSTGKSTFINALLQKAILPSKVTPTTATINFIRHLEEGPGYEVAVVNYMDGRAEEVSFAHLDDYVTEMSQQIEVATEVRHVDLFIDSPYLEDGVVIVDTPGLQALHAEHEKITKQQIKRSHASIFLSNMEQMGKQTEFELLRDVRNSIERIFFIGNRLDGIPHNEVDEVMDSFEHHLRHNEYCKLPEGPIPLFPVSALQALKARDKSVQTKHWNEFSSEQLLEMSRFEDFENRLEEYLFGGDKAKDTLQVPKIALVSHYNRLIDRLSKVKQALDGEVDLEGMREEQTLIEREIELRKLQLKEKTRRIEGVFEDNINENITWFNKQFEIIERELEMTIDNSEMLEELQYEIQDEWGNFYSRYEELTEQGIEELISSLNTAFRSEIQKDEFKLSIEKKELEEHRNEEQAVEIKLSQLEAAAGTEEIRGKVDAELSWEIEELKKEEEMFYKYEQQQRKLQRKEQQIEMQAEMDAEEIRFQQMVLNSTPQMKKEYRVVGRKMLLWEKKEMVDVDNDEYKERLHRLQSKRKEIRMERLKKESERMDLSDDLIEVQSQTSIESREDLRERKRSLRVQKQEKLLEEMKAQSKKSERELNREKRRVKRQIESELMNHKRSYRQLLRNLDALNLAKLRIEQYVAQADEELQKKKLHLQERTQLIQRSEEEQLRVSEIIERYQLKMAEEHIQII